MCDARFFGNFIKKCIEDLGPMKMGIHSVFTFETKR